jgi:hypothetical protein
MLAGQGSDITGKRSSGKAAEGWGSESKRKAK